MKCPICQAKLLPVDGVMFCLQCGNATAADGGETDAPAVEETTDPLLQRAIMDAVHHPVTFKLPVSAATPRPVTSFASLHTALAAQRPVKSAASVPAVASASASVPAVASASSALIPAPVAPAPAPASMADEMVEVSVKRGVTSLNLLPPKAAARMRRLPVWHWTASTSAWVIGAIVFGVFVLVNVGLNAYLASRVYPGVKVGTVAVGGMALSSLRQTLATATMQPALEVTVHGTRYAVDAKALGGPDLERLEQDIREVGRTTPLPIAGLVRGLLSRPVEVHYKLDEPALLRAVAELEDKVNHRSSNALPVVMAGQAFVIKQKTGQKLDAAKAAEAIRKAYGTKTTAALTADDIEPLVGSGAFKADIEAAQARIALSVRLTVRGVLYSPSAAQIGSWLVFVGPGKGVTVDGAQVAAYVASIPGRFDRAATTTALITAVQSGQNLDYTASRRSTATPNLVAAAAWPWRTYDYCLQPTAGPEAEALAQRAAGVLGGPAGWSLGGRLRFVPAERECDFTVALVRADEMNQVDPACADRTTCQVGNVLALSLSAWSAPPTDWKGSRDEYRGEMLQHEVGHWLGFDRPSCLKNDKTATPILQQPTIVLGGCSPNWYVVPAETQGTKVLPGF